jgi:lipopolysaccharide transport system ATP-binding protein
MSDTVIRVEKLGKKYRLGERVGQVTMREVLTQAASAPWRWLGASPSRPMDAAPEIWALKDVSFDVQRGEVLGIIGRNGAGKSTLLKILSRITEPTEGTVELHGRVGSLLEVGTGFHPELTGRENVYLNGAILGMSRVEIARKFDEIVAFSEIEQFLDTPVKRYSSGMYMRLAFAVAAHLEPDILVVDEVLAVGDAHFQKKCLGKMGEIAKHGRTVLFVSHNMGAVALLCRTAIELVAGRVRAIGAAQQVVADYLSDVFMPKSEGLDRLRYAGMGKQIRFTSLRLADADNGTIPFGREFEFVLLVETDIPKSGLSIGASIYDSLGNCVGTTFTRDTFDVAPGGLTELRLTIPSPGLAPGTYYAGFSIGRGSETNRREDFEVVIGAPAFQVTPLNDAAEGPVAHWAPEWGRILLRGTKLRVAERIQTCTR